jgi:TonB family protein
MLSQRWQDSIIFFMWFRLKRSVLLLATIALWYWASPQCSVAQGEPDDASRAPHAVLTKLFPPVYSPLARQAMIPGDVKLKVTVHPDGSIESVTSISGHPMLAQAALDSAKQSQFECRGCGASNGSLSLTFSFQPSQETNPDPCCCSHDPTEPRVNAAPTSTVSQTEDHITIATTGPPSCMCPDACTAAWAEAHSRFRSAKCIYLWKCGKRFIGIQ